MNKPLQRITVIFTLLVMLACNLPRATTITPTVVPEGVSQVPSPTPEAGEQELPPTTLMDFYEKNIREGVWTEDEGLVAILQYALGENILEIPEGIEEVEITSIAIMADQYVQSGANENSKAEIERLLSLLFPSEKRLEAASIPESEAFNHSGKLAAPVPYRQTDCNSFWRDLTDPNNPLGPCFLWGGENIAGQEHRVYFPLAYRGDETKTPYYHAAQEAIRDSINVYSEFGPMPRVYIVFVPYLFRQENIVQLIRAGVPNYRAEEACPVIVFSHALVEDVNNFKQVLAHELFHCFQVKNINRHQPANFQTTQWAWEGSATYFSNVVYPDVDREYTDLPGLGELSLRLPIYKLGYKTFLFFQHMGNQWGNEKVIDFLKTIPINGSFQDQLNNIVAYPDMIDLFESYARRYLANQIADTSGTIHPYEIIYAKVNIITGATTGEMPHNPFVLYREKFIYETPQLDYNFTTTASSSTVRIATAPIDFPAWQVPSWHVDTTCINWEYMTYSIGITTDTTGRLENYDIFTTEIPADQPCEDCLIGTWQMDATSYLTYSNSLFSPRTNPPIAVGFDGESFMEYTAEGKANATYNNFTVYYKNSFPDPNGGPKIQANLKIKFFPTGAVNYSADATTLTYSAGRGRIEVSGEMLLPDGVTRMPYTVPAGAFSDGGTPLTENYVCKGDFLAIKPNLPLPASSNPLPIVFYRFAPPTP